MPLSETFADVVTCLRKIAERWSKGRTDNSDNLASRFTDRLQQAEAAMQGQEYAQSGFLDIRQPVYSDYLRSSRPGTRRESVKPGATSGDQSFNILTGNKSPNASFSPDSMSLAFPPMPLSFQQYQQDSSLIGAEGNTQPYVVQPADEDYMMSSVADNSLDELSKYFDAPFLEVCLYSSNSRNMANPLRRWHG